MEDRKKFTVRFNIEDLLYDDSVCSVFMENIIAIINDSGIKIELDAWYTNKEYNKKILEFEKKYEKHIKNLKYKKYEYQPNSFAWFNIINKSQLEFSSNYKFFSVYSSKDEIILSLFEFFSFLKAVINRSLEDEAGNNRKSVLRKQNEYKKSNMETKKQNK